MNWRRGLARTWIAASALWTAAISVTAIGRWYFDPWREVKPTGKFDPSTAVPIDSLPFLQQGPMPLSEYLLLALGAPCILLLIGVAVYWAVSGFGRS